MRLVPLEFVDSIFNKQVLDDLNRLRSEFHIHKIYPSFDTDRFSIEWPWDEKPFPLCEIGIPADNEISGELSQGVQGDGRRTDLWVAIRTATQLTTTTFNGPRDTAGFIVVNTGVRLFNIRPSKVDGSQTTPDESSALSNQFAYGLLEFIERSAIRHFRVSGRLQDVISMSDDFRNDLALRRFTVVIRA